MTKTKTRSCADPTRFTILKVAEKEFVKKGLDGTSISTIANKAKINQSLIYHHFENKEDLWKQVKVRVLKQFFKYHSSDFKTVENSQNFAAFVRNFVNFRFELYDSNPSIRRMMLWQQLENHPSKLTGVGREIIDKLHVLIEHFQKSNEARNDLDPEVMIAMILQHSISFFTNSYLLSQNFSAAKLKDLKQQYLESTIEALICGLSQR